MDSFKIDTINKTVDFSFEYNKEYINTIKNMDYNSRWNSELLLWIVPINQWSKPKILSFIKQNKFVQIEEKKEEVNISYEVKEIDYAYLKGMTDSQDFLYEPRKYQLEALQYFIDKGDIIIGDDVGLGKTFESIINVETSNLFPCLVITPASVKYNWGEQWKAITKGRRDNSVIETKSPNFNKDIVIINYDIVGKKQGTGATVRFEELLTTPWKMVICDEAHFLKNSKSIRSKAVSKIVKKVRKNGGNVQLLTGTVTMNKPIELWPLLQVIGKGDKIAKDWMTFALRYCGAYRGKFGWDTSGATNIFELNKKLRENCYIRREKSSVIEDMPNVIKQVIHVPISNTKEYNRAIENFIDYMKEYRGIEAADKAMNAEHLVALGVMRKLSIDGKLKYIEQYLKDWKESGEKLLIFGIHREGLEYLSKKFKCSLISGGVNSKKKYDIVQEFQKNDDIFLFLNIQSGGTGIDGLQNISSNMLFIELPWRPSDLEQAIGRLHRSGQKVSVNVTFMLSEDTIDSDMWTMLEEKELITSAVNRGVDVRKSDSGMKSVIKNILKKFKK